MNDRTDDQRQSTPVNFEGGKLAVTLLSREDL